MAPGRVGWFLSSPYRDTKTNSFRARGSQRPGRQESRAAGPLLTAAPLISPDHPLASITVTRAPAAARPPPPSTASLFTRCYSLPPCPSLRSTRPGRARLSTRCPKTGEIYITHTGRGRWWIHSVLLLLRIPSRACGSFRALESCRDPAKSRSRSISQGSPRDKTGSLDFFDHRAPLDFDLAEHCEAFRLDSSVG